MYTHAYKDKITQNCAVSRSILSVTSWILCFITCIFMMQTKNINRMFFAIIYTSNRLQFYGLRKESRIENILREKLRRTKQDVIRKDILLNRYYAEINLRFTTARRYPIS